MGKNSWKYLLITFLLIISIPSPKADAAPKNNSPNNTNSLPFAYGYVNANGSIVYGSGNFTVQKIEGKYMITMAGESYLPGKHLVFITPSMPYLSFAQPSISPSDALTIGFNDASQIPRGTDFQFIIYKTAYSPVLSTYYKDQDADGFGNTADSRLQAYPLAPYTTSVGGDCDDTNAQVYPGAQEICNGIDDDCDGSVDESCTSQTIYYNDEDQDGYGATNDYRLLSEPEGTYTSLVGGDCNNSNRYVNPGAQEVCDGLDNDCDGYVDEGIPVTPCDGGDADSCLEGVYICVGGQGMHCTDTTDNTLEICGDEIDNDCDGYVDENCNINCDDGDACTFDEYDQSIGDCTHTPMSCDDGDPNTLDTCDPGSGCLHFIP